MENPSFSQKLSERKIGRTFVVYLGSAWVFIEAFNFLIDKYNWNANILNIIILLVIFGLPATLIYVWFQRKFTGKAILFQALNGILALSLITYSQVKPENLNTTQLRLIKFKENQKKLASQIESLAILPIGNFTGDEGQEYLASGMHDALITELGQLGTLRVISRTSTLAYSDSRKTIKEIASELNVDAIIEASLLEVQDNIRLQLKLFNVSPEEQQLWTKTYDTNMGDIPNLYNQVLKNISKEIQLTISPEIEMLFEEERKVNPESLKAYYLGMHNIHKTTPEGIAKGIEYLNEAIRIDPDDPLAYAGLALGYLEIEHGFLATGKGYLLAEEAANKALKLDSTIAEAHGALAEINMYWFRDFAKAEYHFKKALDINPNLAHTHYHYAWALYLFGRQEEAIFEHELVYSLDPLNPYYTAFLGALYSYYGRHEDGIVKALESLELQKDYPFGYWVLGEMYLATDSVDKAIEIHEKLARMVPPCSWMLGLTYAASDHIDEAEKILNELALFEPNSWNAIGLAALNGALGNKEEAYKWLTWEPEHAWVPWVVVMPFMESIDKLLENDVRYEDYLRRINIPSINIPR